MKYITIKIIIKTTVVISKWKMENIKNEKVSQRKYVSGFLQRNDNKTIV